MQFLQRQEKYVGLLKSCRADIDHRLDMNLQTSSGRNGINKFLWIKVL